MLRHIDLDFDVIVHVAPGSDVFFKAHAVEGILCYSLA